MKFSTSLVKFGSVGDLALELKKALTAIAAGWNVDHLPDGTHKNPLPPPGDSGDVLTSVGGEWSSEAPPSSAGIHAPTHSSGSTDPVTVTNLAGYPGGTANFLRADATFAAPPGGGGGAPSAHATTHQPGGSDPMAVDAVAATGSLRTLGTGAQQAASGTDSRFTNARTPTAHATTHQPGGSDAMAVDAAAATGSLRTLGTTSTSAAAGNDARLTDARTPTAHAPTHTSGGSDAIKLDELAAPTDITTLNASTTAHGLLPKLSGASTQFLNGFGLWLTPTGAGDVVGPPSAVHGNLAVFTGTTGKFIVDSTLPQAQVARLDTTNTFLQEAVYSSAAPTINYIETDQPANQKIWRTQVNGQTYQIIPADDAYVGPVQLALSRTGQFSVGGSLFERGRSSAMGEWIAVPFSAANFAGSGSMTWTVTAGQVTTNRYTLIGKTLLWQLAISASSLSGAAATTLRVTIPGGLSLAAFSTGAGQAYNTGSLLLQPQGGPGTTLTVYRADGGNYVSPDSALYVYLSVMCEVS